MSHDPDAPCGCNSGLTFKSCHGRIFAAPKPKKLSVGQSLYASAWAHNADAYRVQGIYAALARHLKNSGEVRRVLDIGCGLGHGIEALAAALRGADFYILGLDENPYCLQAAARRFGLTPNHPALKRLKSRMLLSEHFLTEPVVGKFDPAGKDGLDLAQVDLLLPDQAFLDWLDEQAKFDALTLWLSGVHGARSAAKVVQTLGLGSDTELRERLEEDVLALAERRLRSGGLVQIVNRFAGPDIEVLCKAYRRCAEELMVGGPFNVIDVAAFPYEDPKHESAVQVKSTAFDITGATTAAFSLLLRLG